MKFAFLLIILAFGGFFFLETNQEKLVEQYCIKQSEQQVRSSLIYTDVKTRRLEKDEIYYSCLEAEDVTEPWRLALRYLTE